MDFVRVLAPKQAKILDMGVRGLVTALGFLGESRRPIIQTLFCFKCFRVTSSARRIPKSQSGDQSPHSHSRSLRLFKDWPTRTPRGRADEIGGEGAYLRCAMLTPDAQRNFRKYDATSCRNNNLIHCAVKPALRNPIFWMLDRIGKREFFALRSCERGYGISCRSPDDSTPSRWARLCEPCEMSGSAANVDVIVRSSPNHSKRPTQESDHGYCHQRQLDIAARFTSIDRTCQFAPSLPKHGTFSWAALVLGGMWVVIGLVGASIPT